METLEALPVGFWATALILSTGTFVGMQRLRDGIGIPILVVIGTVMFWYPGDALYNDYASYHMTLFDHDVLSNAWWQVASFVAAFLLVTPPIHRWMNANLLGKGSGVLWLFTEGVDVSWLQRQIGQLFKLSIAIWMTTTAIAAIRVGGEVVYFLFPFLGHNVSAFGRARLGGGFDAILTMLFYIHELACAAFGIVAAASRERRTRFLALLFCFISWPVFLFDRTRNNILVVIMPGILTWGFLGIRGGMIRKLAILAGCFVMVNAWMGFVIANRSNDEIGDAFRQKGFDFHTNQKVRHEGLNMYEELCWINTFLAEGTYHVNWGTRYFAELVNFVPRTLWPGKPEIGIDYAIARGAGGGSRDQAGVYATVSTGMIGQGVVNFGAILGPPFAAFLMSIWCALLARLDLNSSVPGNLFLYALGLILTFNMGRDISLIILYPFIFGRVLLWFQHRKTQDTAHDLMQTTGVNSTARLMSQRLAGLRPICRRPIQTHGDARTKKLA